MPSKIKIKIPSALRYECEGLSELSTEADTISEVLEWLKDQHPNLYRNVCQETDQVRPHVNIFLNDRMICKESELDTQVSANDELFILPSVSGG